MHEVRTLADWLKSLNLSELAGARQARLLLSLQTGARPLSAALTSEQSLTFLSGPEGGLSPAEEAAAIACGFAPVTLGPRVLRAETAPLACLSLLGLS